MHHPPLNFKIQRFVKLQIATEISHRKWDFKNLYTEHFYQFKRFIFVP